MNKKTLAAVVAAMLILCAFSAIALLRCTSSNEDPADISTENSESSDVDESTASEPSDASETEEARTDVSDTSKDPAPETSTPAEESDVSEPETSEVETSTAPEGSDPPSDESSEPYETSKVEEPSQPDEPSEPEDTSTTPSEIVKPNQPNEESTVEETSKDETSKDETSKEENVIYGDTPVEIVVNGKQETVTSYEEAKALLTLEMIEAAEKGYEIVIEKGGRTLTLTSNGNGTYTSSSGSTRSAQQVYDTYISQWCRDCGKRVGHGDNGTCTYFLHDTNCPYCGDFCKAQECHTCDE